MTAVITAICRADRYEERARRCQNSAALLPARLQRRSGMVTTINTDLSFDLQFNRYRVSVLKTEEELRAHFNVLVSYFNIYLSQFKITF
jgi:hypothetical protein